MKLYEFVNPSDKITFYAPDDDIAFAVSVLVGNGQADYTPDDNHETPTAMISFMPNNKQAIERFKGIMDSRINEVVDSAHTFACCGFPEREIYNDYTNNGTNQEKRAKWDDKNRTSMNNFCKYAWNLKKQNTVTDNGSQGREANETAKNS